MIQVLIIEDDPMVAKFNRIYLDKVPGFELVGTADSVRTGWQLLQSKRIDLILLDIYMATENGLDLLMEIRKTNYPVDVIVISSANDHASVQTALRYGAVDYLIKPFDFERFQEALLRYKQRFDQMQKEGIQQDDLDQLFRSGSRNQVRTEEHLPKGITKETYTRVLREINELGDWFSTADLAERTGISRVSLRKYLRFLEDSNILLSNVSYEGSGRPLQQYKLGTDGRDYVLSIIQKGKETES